MSNKLYKGNFAQNRLLKELQGDSVNLRNVVGNDAKNFIDGDQLSFRLDPPGTGLKSTQQLMLDWSNFENHTFFNSAQAKTNVAFESVFNQFPFDGDVKSINSFLDSLTGFEKYVFDSIPKNTGYLNFDSSNHINVIDSAGVLFPEMSKDRTGSPKIDPGNASMTVEMQLFVPSGSNSNQVIMQKINGTSNGFTLALSQSSAGDKCNLDFYISSGSTFMTSSLEVTKGKFSSIAAQFNRASGVDRLYLFQDGSLISSSSVSAYIGTIDFKVSPLLIGSGTNHALGSSYTFTPAARLSGSIDDLRIFHLTRTAQQISSSMYSTVYPADGLKLLYRFNEPTGSYTNNSIVIDHSGNGLHATISNFSSNQRIPHVSNPLIFEKKAFSPILFPDHPSIVTLNESLLLSASQYDQNNPNLITKLIPQHYLTREQEFYVLDSIEGGVGDSIDEGNSLPRETRLGSIQLISSLLYVWAKQFDETKCFLDHVSRLRSTDYNDVGTVSDQMLPYLADYYGVNLPNMFKGVSLPRYILGESETANTDELQLSFQAIQNTIWRRILNEFPSVMKSRGTLHAIKSLIRAAGIETDSIMKFREYGGPKSGYITTERSQRSITQGFLNFSGSLFNGTVNYDPVTGVPSNLPFVSSSYLSASRIEPGIPTVSNTVSDGLFTSGSWSYEAIYKFEPNTNHTSVQSLARLHVTGTSSPSNTHGLMTNLVLTAGSSTSSLDLYVGSDVSSSGRYLKLSLGDNNIFDGSSWHISFGRKMTENVPSSSYFVWAARANNDVSNYSIASASYFDEGTAVDTVSAYNKSGSFLCIGPQSIFEGGNKLLNDISVPDSARETMFSGKVSKIRFWTKSLTEAELLEHAKNVESLGVESPKLNYNFVTQISGSWERLRIDASCVQEITSSAASGGIRIFDYSQNNFHLTGSGFGNEEQVIENERVKSSAISMQFDEAQTSNKVRIRSYLDYDTARREGVSVAPISDVLKSEIPVDDSRFSIEVSATQVLDEDIAKIFATLDEMDDAIGGAELQFSPDYPNLENLRDVYFNRLTEKIKIKQLYEFFKWFDTSMGSLIEKFIPSNTRFLGSNYVVKPHALERAKFSYLQSGIYIGENDRRGLKGTIRLGQVTATLRRF